MNVNDFFSIGGPTKYVDRMCALLAIRDTSRFKIVGIYQGSTIVQSFLDEDDNADNTSKTLEEIS